MADIEQTNLTALTVDLLSAYFANNTVDSAQLSGLIQSTHAALKGIDTPAPETPPSPEIIPATTVRKSLSSPDHIISMIDGKPYKTLTRHLSTKGLTPAEYRERYKLPHDYPMVAPAYSQARRDVAARLGLGRKPTAAVEAPVETTGPVETAPVGPAATSPEPKAKTKASAKAAASAKPATVKKAPAGKAKATPAKATKSADAAPVVASETPVQAPKKTPGRKPKVPAASAEGTSAPATPVKRAPRKAKAPVEPLAN